MARVIYKLKVESILDHTPSVRELDLRYTGDPLRFQAGQFAMLHVPPKSELRAYSFASDDRNENGFRLLFKYVDNGVASEFVWSLKGGETLDFTGPFGRLFFKEPPTTQVIFLNTGTGVAQHLSYLLSKGEQFPNVRYRMLFGVRNESEIYHKNYLDDLATRLPNFQYDFVLSQPGPDWRGKRGYVQHYLNDFDYRNIESTIYLCGNGNMIKELKARLLKEENFPKERFFAEAFD